MKLLHNYLITYKSIKNEIKEVPKEKRLTMKLDSYSEGILVALPIIIASMNLFIYLSILPFTISLIALALIGLKVIQQFRYYKHLKIKANHVIALNLTIYSLIVIILAITAIILVRILI